MANQMGTTRRPGGLSLGMMLGAAGAAVAILVVGLVVVLVDEHFAIGAMIALGVTLTILVQLRAHQALVERQRSNLKHLDQKNAEHYRQLEALVGLTACLQPVAPFPAGRGWAASPDLLRLLATQVLTERPSNIIELGGGYSSLVIGYSLKKIGGGRLVSLDHDAAFAEQTREAVELHGLGEYVTVIHAPLVVHTIEGEQWQWYDTAALHSLRDIDMAVVDGPPAGGNPLARFPALPLLAKHLGPGACVILDDGVRSGERDIVDRWSASSRASFEYHHLEKGAFVGRWS